MKHAKIEQPIKLPRIEKGIPTPRLTTELSDLAARMEVGDSVFFTTQKSASKFRDLIQRRGLRLEIPEERRAISRAVDGGIRVWRTV